MWDIILAPLAFLYKAWYITPLVILVADKIVAMTPLPWDDLIVTGAKKTYEKITSAIGKLITVLLAKPISFLFGKKEEKVEESKCTCGKDNCCK
jgi:hypothetical protein